MNALMYQYQQPKKEETKEETMYSIPMKDLQYVHTLPDKVKQEVVKNIHDYVEQVRKDYPMNKESYPGS